MGRALIAALAVASLCASSAAAIGVLGEWGGRGSASGRFAFPASVAVNGNGRVYVADAENDRVQVFDEDGVFHGQWGGAGSGPGQFETPEAVAVDATGDVYVADQGSARIQKFDSSGSQLAQWGGAGTGPGQLQSPEAIDLDAAGNVYVADAGNDRIQKFDPSGAFLAQWGGSGTADGLFDTPDGVAVADGAVYVADSGNDRIQKFTEAGAFLEAWGEAGDGPGQFDFPVAVATDSAGRVFVADAVNDRVQLLGPSGRFLSEWGTSGDGPGQLEDPVDVAPSSTGRVFVADAGNDRIQYFGSLPRPRYGKSFNLAAVRGVVRVRLPGSKRFAGLGAERQLPVGTVVDAGAGRVRLTSASGPGGGSQTADFYSGAFRVLQPRRGRPLTVLKLVSRLRCGGRAGARGRAGRRPRSPRKRARHGLWGSGRGSFRSQGRHGSATVRGTVWWVGETCRGTLFRVRRGVVTVRDFTQHRKIKLRRGQRYLAPRG